MQPTYLTLASTTPSAWKLVNWHATPQQISFAVISTGGSSYFISATLEDPTATYPNVNFPGVLASTTPTAFTLFTGSSNAMFSVGSSVTFPIGHPIAAYQFTVNTQSSAGAKVTLISMQSGIG